MLLRLAHQASTGSFSVDPDMLLRLADQASTGSFSVDPDMLLRLADQASLRYLGGPPLPANLCSLHSFGSKCRTHVTNLYVLSVPSGVRSVETTFPDEAIVTVRSRWLP